MSISSDDIIKYLKKEGRASDGRPYAKIEVLSNFFNSFLKKKAIDKQLSDYRVIQRFFNDWSANNFAKLKQLFQSHSDEEAVDILTKDLQQYNVSIQDIRHIINLQYVIYLRVLAIPPVHKSTNAMIRDKMFNILVERGNMKADIVRSLLHDECIQVFREAFTNISAMEEYDYDLWEALGDGIAKGFLRFYLLRRFPELRTSKQPAYLITAASQSYEKNMFFSNLFDSLHLADLACYIERVVWVHPYRVGKISKLKQQHQQEQEETYFYLHLDKDIKADMMEALFAAIQYVVDLYIQPGLGNAVCYNIFSSIYDEQQMTIDIKELGSRVMLLKEIFDTSPVYGAGQERIDPQPSYSEPEAGSGEHEGYFRVKVRLTFRPDRERKGRGLIPNLVAPVTHEIYSDYFNTIKEDAEADAARKALEFLEKTYGIVSKKLK